MNGGWLLVRDARTEHFFKADGKSMCGRVTTSSSERNPLATKDPCRDCMRVLSSQRKR